MKRLDRKDPFGTEDQGVNVGLFIFQGVGLFCVEGSKPVGVHYEAKIHVGYNFNRIYCY